MKIQFIKSYLAGSTSDQILKVSASLLSYILPWTHNLIMKTCLT